MHNHRMYFLRSIIIDLGTKRILFTYNAYYTLFLESSRKVHTSQAHSQNFIAVVSYFGEDLNSNLGLDIPGPLLEWSGA